MLILVILSAVAIRFNTKPAIYTGFIFALAGVLFIGFYAENKLYGGILGAFTVSLGLLLRSIWPQASTLKGDKLVAFMEKFNAYQDFIAKYFVLLILAGFLVGYIGGIVGNIIEDDRSSSFSTYRITYVAIFIAMSVAINTIRIGSVSFGGFPIIMAGFFLGPINGFITGAVADLLGFLVRPSSSGAFNPLFTLTSALTGLIPVVVTRAINKKSTTLTFVTVLVGVFVGQLITSVILVPIFRVILQGKNTFLYYFTQALIKQLVSVPIYAFLIVATDEKIGKFIKTNKSKAQYER